MAPDRPHDSKKTPLARKRADPGGRGGIRGSSQPSIDAVARWLLGSRDGLFRAAGVAKLRVKPGAAGLSTGGFWLTAAGIAATTFGSMFLFVGHDDITDFQTRPLILIGGASTGIGITMMSLGSTSFEKIGTVSPLRQPSSATVSAWRSAERCSAWCVQDDRKPAVHSCPSYLS